MRISNSFSEGEIQILEFILQTLLRGGSPTMAARHKEFASLYRKVVSMKTRVHELEKKEAEMVKRGERTAPESSSVGVIAAAEEVELEQQAV